MRKNDEHGSNWQKVAKFSPRNKEGNVRQDKHNPKESSDLRSRNENIDGRREKESLNKESRNIVNPISQGNNENNNDRKNREGDGTNSKNHNGGNRDASKANVNSNYREAHGDTRHKKRTICRYFLEDNCRFKENCWFSHDNIDLEEEAERMKTNLSFLENRMRRIKKQ